MKQYIGSIKVGDLLRSIGSTDRVVFEHKYVGGITTIVEPGISGEIKFQSLNNTSVQAFINLTCIVTDISDISGDEYERNVVVEDYEILCSIPTEDGLLDEIYDSYQDIYEIDKNHLTVNIEDCIINAIKSQEPIVKIKNDETLGEGGIEVVDLPPL